MAADRLLNTLLQRYQDVHAPAETEQIIATTAHLLSRLANPLNLGVLTSQLLTAPAIWHGQDGPRLALRIIAIYSTAASRVRDNDAQGAHGTAPSHESRLRCDEWARAVVKGVDDRSRPWQHLLVLTGVLVGMQGHDRPSLSRTLSGALERAVITATNRALEHTALDGLLASASLLTALNFSFPLLSDANKPRLNCSALLPIAVWAITGEHGFCDGQFLKAVSDDTVEDASHVLSWPPRAPSYQMLQQLDGQPLMANMGPLSKLAAFAVQHATDSAAVLQAQDALLVFTGRVLDAWRRSAVSGVDPDFEATRLAPDTRLSTWPLVWQVLRKLMFASVAVLQAIVSRSLLDPNMLANGMGAGIAARSLHILRNLFFISSRNGNNAFQVYTFSYLTSLDVLSRDPVTCQGFLRETRGADVVSFPASLPQRTLDLFHLNVAEHLPLALSASLCQTLIIEPAVAYLSHDGPLSPFGVELFESAHSAILSVLSCPQHSPLTIDIIPFYIVKLFESFPLHISPRQFRVAFKTLMEVVSPPFPISATRPELSETLLEMLRCNIATASTTALGQKVGSQSQEADVPLSEQSALVMALVDSLPFLPPALVEEWLGCTAQVMNDIADPILREPVKRRFLDVLVNGEMDVERSTIGIAWWGTNGGREAVMRGSVGDRAMMSGAIGGSNERQSRL